MAVNSISEYIEGLNENGKKYVEEFIKFMDENYSNLNCKICFSMPMWLIGNKMNEGYVAISAAKNHFSIHFSNEIFVIDLGEKLPVCKLGKRCINIKYGDDEYFNVVKDNVGIFIESAVKSKL